MFNQTFLELKYTFLSLNIENKSPEEWVITKQACRDKSVVLFYFQYLLRSTLLYRALYYGKIETQISIFELMYVA